MSDTLRTDAIEASNEAAWCSCTYACDAEHTPEPIKCMADPRNQADNLRSARAHQALFSRGIVFCKSLIAAPLTRFQKMTFGKMKVFS